MKKSNVIIFALLAVVSAFLLWLWYYLRLNLIDDPLDLVLSVIWWVVIAVAIGVILKTEQIRRRRIRTVYVGGDATFNSEKGLMRFEGTRPMPEVIASILANLKYDFSRSDFPDKDKFQVTYFVRTKEFKAEDRQRADQPIDEVSDAAVPAEEEQKTWKGEVVIVDTKEERPFETPEELASIIASIEQAA